MLAAPVNFSLLASLPVMFSTEEMRPPYCAGILLLYSSTSCTMSELNAEKKPNRWLGLYIVPLFSNSRFWSVAPPRTLYPLEASPTVLMPGRVCIIFSTSTSPIAVGMFFRSLGWNFSMPNCVPRTFSTRPEVTTTSSSRWSSSSRMMLAVPSA